MVGKGKNKKRDSRQYGCTPLYEDVSGVELEVKMRRRKKKKEECVKRKRERENERNREEREREETIVEWYSAYARESGVVCVPRCSIRK